MGFVHDVDLNSLLALKRQLGEPSELEHDHIKETPLKELSFEPFDVKVRFKKQDKIQDYSRLGDYVRYKDITVGKGEIPLKGYKVRIEYTIHTANGTIIDSKDPSMKKLLPWKRKVVIAVGKLCPGLDFALQSTTVK